MRYTRDILMVSGKYDGETVHVFVNHWPSRRGGEAATTKYRQAAAAVCKNIIDSLTAIDPNVKVLVMGDFNDDPISPSVKDVLQAKAKKGQVKDGGLYNPWVDFYKKGIGTLSYRGAWNLFDQIIMSSGWLDEKQSGYRLHTCEIYNERYLMNRFGQYKEGPLRSYGGARYLGGYSDHFPVYMYVVKAVN